MPEWKEKIFEVKGATQIGFVSSPDGRLYALVMVGEKGVNGLMNAFVGTVGASND